MKKKKVVHFLHKRNHPHQTHSEHRKYGSGRALSKEQVWQSTTPPLQRGEWHLLKQAIPTKNVIRHSGEGRNPEKRPPWVDMDPGLRREDGAFKLK